MAKSNLYEYIILFHPKEKKDAAGNPLETKKSILVKEPTSVLAETEQEVGMIAARSIPAEYEDKFNDLEIKIRPF